MSISLTLPHLVYFSPSSLAEQVQALHLAVVHLGNHLLVSRILQYFFTTKPEA